MFSKNLNKLKNRLYSMDKIKLISLILAIIAIANILLFAFRIIQPLLFWGVIFVLAILTYYGMPWLKEELK